MTRNSYRNFVDGFKKYLNERNSLTQKIIRQYSREKEDDYLFVPFDGEPVQHKSNISHTEKHSDEAHLLSLINYQGQDDLFICEYDTQNNETNRHAPEWNFSGFGSGDDPCEWGELRTSLFRYEEISSPTSPLTEKSTDHSHLPECSSKESDFSSALSPLGTGSSSKELELTRLSNVHKPRASSYASTNVDCFESLLKELEDPVQENTPSIYDNLLLTIGESIHSFDMLQCKRNECANAMSVNSSPFISPTQQTKTPAGGVESLFMDFVSPKKRRDKSLSNIQTYVTTQALDSTSLNNLQVRDEPESSAFFDFVKPNKRTRRTSNK